jgi:hypothetical protein
VSPRITAEDNIDLVCAQLADNRFYVRQFLVRNAKAMSHQVAKQRIDLNFSFEKT